MSQILLTENWRSEDFDRLVQLYDSVKRDMPYQSLIKILLRESLDDDSDA